MPAKCWSRTDGLRSSGAVRDVEKGRNEIVSAFFRAGRVHVRSHTVTGRLMFLSVVRPDLVILRVTPLPA
jgi:hypothetical protein